MRVVSTGSSGTLGGSLPGDVIALSHRLGRDPIKSIEKEIINGSSLIHLAGVIGEPKVLGDSNSQFINVEATFSFARECIAAGVGKFIYASTGHVYAPSKGPVSELAACDPVSEYGRQKLNAELGLISIFEPFPQRLVIARIFSILDYGMPEFSLGGLASKILTNRDNLVVENSDDVRDFLDKKTVADALYTLAINLTQFQIYNICSSTPLSVKQAIVKFIGIAGGNVEGVSFASGTSSRPFLAGNNDKFLLEFPNERLDWNPRSNL